MDKDMSDITTKLEAQRRANERKQAEIDLLNRELHKGKKECSALIEEYFREAVVGSVVKNSDGDLMKVEHVQEVCRYGDVYRLTLVGGLVTTYRNIDDSPGSDICLYNPKQTMEVEVHPGIISLDLALKQILGDAALFDERYEQAKAFRQSFYDGRGRPFAYMRNSRYRYNDVAFIEDGRFVYGTPVRFDLATGLFTVEVKDGDGRTVESPGSELLVVS